ncbi:MAG TPA: protein phosphatase 2C domain-containing protein, partial [Dehalococcoidia bacterium]|nr:protein phosphatase 2C domain-containing protein [Dehalococcoidia bacterium]
MAQDISANPPELTIMSLAQEAVDNGAAISTIADCAAATHGGPVRIHNEDHCLTLMSAATNGRPRRYLLAVADGVGGHNAGEVASETAIETLRKCFEECGASAPHKWVTNALRKANLAVFDHAHTDPSYRAMQTTLTAVLIQGDQVAVGHVGDSRAYRFREGAVHQLTQDHTHFLDLLRVRLVTADQAMHHPAVHQLTRSLGAQPIVRADVVRDRIAEGDTYVVCSDGLWGSLSRGNLQRVIGDLPAEDACRRLIDLGVTLDADDNMSVGVA